MIRFFCTIGSCNGQKWFPRSSRPPRAVYATVPDDGSMGSIPQEELNKENLEAKIKGLEKNGVPTYIIEQAMYVLGKLEQRGDKEGIKKLEEATEQVPAKGFEVYKKTLNDLESGSSSAPESATETEQTKAATRSKAPAKAVDILQSEVAAKASATLQALEIAQTQVGLQQEYNKKLAEKLIELRKELLILVKEEEKSQSKTKALLGDAINKGYLSMDEAQDVLNLGPEDGNERMEKDMYEIMSEMMTGGAGEKNLAAEIIKTKKSEIKQYSRILENLEKFHMKMVEVEEYIYQEAYRERAIKEHSRNLGFDLKENAVLRLHEMRAVVDKDGKPVRNEDGKIKEEPVLRRATVKKVSFENIEITDAKGNKKSVPDLMPHIELEFEDEEPDATGDRRKGTKKYTAGLLRKIMDVSGMVQPIEEIGSLATLLGIGALAVGSVIEYRTIINEDVQLLRGKDQAVTIEKIVKEPDPFFTESENGKQYEQTYVYLSDEVEVASETETSSEPDRRKKLTLGEFARWYKRVNAFEPMKTAEIKGKLKELNEQRNAHYNRPPNHFPPIECTPGEQLYYNTASKPTFLIKSVDEDGIRLDNGSHFTPASFYNWVKENEVEKRSADAEASQATDAIQDEAEKKRMKKLLEDKIKKEMEDRKNPPNDKFLDNDAAVAEPSISYIRTLWNQTYFMSFGDLYTMGKTIYEFIVRKLGRREKDRVGAVGNAMFTPVYSQLGAEFKTLQQTAENEEVQRYSDAYKQFGPDNLYQELEKTSNKDELKAILNALADKGAIRWEDKLLWDAINRVSMANSSYPELIKQYDEEQIRKILDSFWGGQSFYDFRSRNDSSYNGNRDKFSEVARRRENDPAGKNLKVALQEMLFKHLHGEYIDPSVYEGHIHWAVKGGKMSFQDKVYFIMMGLGGFGDERFGKYPGQSLLTLTRVSDFSTFTNNFPIIDYFGGNANLPQFNDDLTPKMEVDKETGELKQAVRPATINNVRKIMRDYHLKTGKTEIGNPKDLTPGKDFVDFIQKEMMYNVAVEERFHKSSNDMSQWDHDDFHIMAQLMTEEGADQMTIRGAGKAQATTPGVKNAFVGWDNAIKIQQEEFRKNAKDPLRAEEAQRNLNNWMRPIRSFVRVNAALDSRMHHFAGAHDRKRWTSEFDQRAGVDERGLTVRSYVKEMNTYIETFLTEAEKHAPTEIEDLAKAWKIINTKYSWKDKRALEEQEATVKNFGITFENSITALKGVIGYKGIADIMETVQAAAPVKGMTKGT